MQQASGSFRLFKAAGVDVFLHWSWLVVAFFQIRFREDEYESPIWKVLEYLTLFGIVLLHEFGHALACRQVGGVAERIVLWPLGGVAYVNPPPRAGALLWSIVAGPLVNVILIPVLFALNFLASQLAVPNDLRIFLFSVQVINVVILVFNMLPIYPLDGGQILRALLWFVVGRHRSLFAASVIGAFGAVGVFGLAIALQSIWLGVIAVFMILQCVRAFREGRILAQIAAAPRHDHLQCPGCGAMPIRGPLWPCRQCGVPFDGFDTHGKCPECGAAVEAVVCFECRRPYALHDWRPAHVS